MKKYMVILLVAFICHSNASANDFFGEWKVSKLIFTVPYFKDIRYPKWFRIENRDGTISGRYKDQYNYEDNFELVVFINNNQEMLLSHCCGTKHPESWSPLHKVKIINGELHGVVVTNRFEFEWIAEKIR